MARQYLIAFCAALCWCIAAFAGHGGNALQLERGVLVVRGQTERSLDLPTQWSDSASLSRRLRLRIDFDVDEAVAATATRLLIPFLYDGGRVLLNGAEIARLRETDASHNVRLRKPHLFWLSSGQLKAGTNRLELDVPIPEPGATVYFPSPVFGPAEALQAQADIRQFWLFDATRITLAISLLLAVSMLIVWAMRPQEVLYGLFGIAVLLWGMRTATFLVEVVPMAWWLPWRVFHHFVAMSSGVALAIYALRFAQLRFPRMERGLLVLAVVPAILIIMSGGAWDIAVGRFSGAVATLVVGGVASYAIATAAWRQRTTTAFVILAAFVLIVVASIHDYMMFWQSHILHRLLPDWTEHGILLLRYAVNVLYLAMAVGLIHRFVSTLDQFENLNRTLEQRILDAEKRIATDYQRISELEREQATVDERQRIMQDMHDGLGSRLVVSLAAAERGDLAYGDMSGMLRDCIGEMRLTLDALSPDDDDFATVLTGFRYRWRQQLIGAGLDMRWEGEFPEGRLRFAPHVTLQLLRIFQEALTNVVKHAKASTVIVRCRLFDDRLLEIEVADDGKGLPPELAGSGHGLRNMRRRAERLGAELKIDSGAKGTVLHLAFPLPS